MPTDLFHTYQVLTFSVFHILKYLFNWIYEPEIEKYVELREGKKEKKNSPFIQLFPAAIPELGYLAEVSGNA